MYGRRSHDVRAVFRVASGEVSAQHPMKHPGIRRATAAPCPSYCRKISHATPVNVRAMVGATARMRPGNRWANVREWRCNFHAVATRWPRRLRVVSRNVRKRGHVISASSPQLRRVRRRVLVTVRPGLHSVHDQTADHTRESRFDYGSAAVSSISCSHRNPSALQIDPPASSGIWPLPFRVRDPNGIGPCVSA